MDLKITLTIASIIIVFLLKLSVKKITESYTIKNQYSQSRKIYIQKVSSFALTITLMTVLSIIWDLTIQGLSIYFVSLFTVLGVAFFASWSIISNITASIVLFFNHPFKIGDNIKIQDGDNSVTGEIVDINLFNIRIKSEGGHIVAYPNNLALQKPIYKLSSQEDSNTDTKESEMEDSLKNG
ncbi:mechanosensitive ion channel family protein [Aureibacter tunicatorum]|uniref:Small-conductance mechanosensitive channel n=1 Tax=Aureibacter tunicatorum TaxID=866807 RepID=A0AAE4BUE7_9BACT|nr:mechanosensitive ion channel family protein [Aureibacter tunicatorum]MDR6240688.1 small-conductance mechanosensitive channel [Aureibacter tunicatorum]BDD06979.1 hypothetical protein AUTU_44620 [Aureibacter tunicatorum]